MASVNKQRNPQILRPVVGESFFTSNKFNNPKIPKSDCQIGRTISSLFLSIITNLTSLKKKPHNKRYDIKDLK